MKTFNIEIQEFLARTITVSAKSATDARTKIQNKYKDEEIILDSDDHIETKFIELDEIHVDEKTALIDKVLDYLMDAEKKHFEELEIKPKDHIYLTLLRLRTLNRL